MKYTMITAMAISAGLLFSACSKDKDDVSNGSHNLEVRMTDAPFDATEVNVDIAKVQVHLSNHPDSGWYDMPTMSGKYNLLALQNGVDVVIANGPVPDPTITEIRLILNDNNSIMIDGIVYPLTVPSGEQTGLKIKLDKTLTAPNTVVLIDFDAGLSVHLTGNGKYMLRPVLKLK